MTEEKTTALRERMIEDMRIRGMGDKAQKGHIRAIKDFAAFLRRSPDTATPEELRAYQLHMTNAGLTGELLWHSRQNALRVFLHRWRRSPASFGVLRSARTAFLGLSPSIFHGPISAVAPVMS
ncbi:phage integrase N-terminal SAM-like domain-containing protein (plasmid) [Ensifer sp. D2-11]